MQRPLLVLACATSVAVGVLCAATATAYASPVTGERVVSAPSLVVPPNYRPAKFAASGVTALASGVALVTPGSAVSLDGRDETPSADDPATEPIPSATPTPSPSDGSANNGHSSDKTNSGNDLNNKGDGSNKDKGKVKGKDKGSSETGS